MMIDYSISIGHILTVISFLGGGLYVLIKQTVTFGIMEAQLKAMQAEISKIAKIVLDNAVMQQRMLNIEEDIRDLKKGKGWITNEVSGEYSRFGKIIREPPLTPSSDDTQPK